MLVLTLHLGKTIHIGDDIQIMLTEVNGHTQARLAFEAPREVRIERDIVRQSRLEDEARRDRVKKGLRPRGKR